MVIFQNQKERNKHLRKLFMYLGLIFAIVLAGVVMANRGFMIAQIALVFGAPVILPFFIPKLWNLYMDSQAGKLVAYDPIAKILYMHKSKYHLRDIISLTATVRKEGKVAEASPVKIVHHYSAIYYLMAKSQIGKTTVRLDSLQVYDDLISTLESDGFQAFFPERFLIRDSAHFKIFGIAALMGLLISCIITLVMFFVMYKLNYQNPEKPLLLGGIFLAVLITVAFVKMFRREEIYYNQANSQFHIGSTVLRLGINDEIIFSFRNFQFEKNVTTEVLLTFQGSSDENIVLTLDMMEWARLLLIPGLRNRLRSVEE